MIDLLKTNGNWYKANLHAHSTCSDGKMTPQEVKDWYKAHGYSIVAYTDHRKFVHYPELQEEDFLPIAGVEADFICADENNDPLKFKVCHLNFWAKNPETAVHISAPRTYEVGYINRYIAKMKANGFICGLNHPSWSQQTSEEVNELRGLTCFEVYNHGSQVKNNIGYDQHFWSRFLNNGNHAYAVATDDNHVGFDENGNIGPGNDTCGGFVYISMPELSYEAFAEALENGRFYPSTGVEIYELYIDEEADELVLKCSGVNAINVKGVHTTPAKRISGYENELTEARIPLAPIREKEPFIRLELLTTDGKTAYSQPYYF